MINEVNKAKAKFLSFIGTDLDPLLPNISRYNLEVSIKSYYSLQDSNLKSNFIGNMSVVGRHIV